MTTNQVCTQGETKYMQEMAVTLSKAAQSFVFYEHFSDKVDQSISSESWSKRNLK
jgi:hypothetical protein